MGNQKKSFKDSIQTAASPANAFISEALAEMENTSDHAAEIKENKSARINLLFRPSTKKNIEKLAFIHHTSTNDFINTIMDEYIANHAADIERYDSFFSEENQTV